MKTIVRSILLVCAIAAVGAGSVQAADIVDIAASNKDFSTLVKAVQAAGLVETLKGEGPFTVFAPTDKAFAKLPKETVESLLKPENKDQLIAVLTYHVVPGKVMAADVARLNSGTKVETVNGAKVTLNKQGNVIMLDRSRITATDIVASNGVIHVIDTVLIPPKDNSSTKSSNSYGCSSK